MALSRTVTVIHVVHILHILWRRLFRELTFFFLWKDVRESWIFPFYALDCLSYLSITPFVLVCNLYIVFVASATPHDMITSTVTLNFIFDRLPHFKRTLLDGSSGKRLLAARTSLVCARSTRLVRSTTFGGSSAHCALLQCPASQRSQP